MKIDIDVKEFKELVKLLTPQVTVIDNGQPQAVSPAPFQPLPTINEIQTSEKDYFATVSKLSAASASDKAEALAIATANGFEYEKTSDGNGNGHQSIADHIEAAKALILHNGN